MKHTFKMICIICFSSCIFSLAATGQEEVEIQVEATPAASFGVMKMQSGDGESVQMFTTDFSGFGGGDLVLGAPSFMGDEFSMVAESSFQDELNLVPEQRDQISQLNKEYGKRMSDYFKKDENGRLNLGEPGDIQSFMKQIQDDKAAKIKEILLPHQLDRLRQISLQTEMRHKGDSNALIGDKIAEELGIDDEQKKRIKAKAAELKEKLQKEIDKLKEQTREELLGELTGEQRSKLKEMLGDRFEPKQPNLVERAMKMRDPGKREPKN